MSSRSRWRSLLEKWRNSKIISTEESFVKKKGGGSALAAALSTIQRDREQWAGTQRTVCTEDEFEERYFIREMIGQGAYGMVYHAIRVEDAKSLAVKEIEVSDSDTARRQAIDECVLWQALSSPYHPCVLPLLEIIEVEASRSLRLVTDIMPCGTLSDLVLTFEGGAMSEQSIRLVMIQIASAVEHLHCVHCIAHRDLKPQNILCEGDDPTMIGCLKLADFGCARRFESLTEPSFDDPIGTHIYFSPELAAAWVAEGPVKYAGPPADCWALGAIACA